ncbi:3'-5' exonuclease [Novosphingobium decolorationis]|uniref:3'-5' exonuclease n=1 Tax=Novosphingobium decolorationis TaxID=2698673 RepID=A0ABX8E7Z9_9SPHN|nr:3'-5' exonuclease [Novosphingobium decolorationis]QVM85179.1 3'-5' exonuclease [Novosphingobium decolorationis]
MPEEMETASQTLAWISHDPGWPLVTLDFEASCLDVGSYPIEVGLCRWDGPESRAREWSALIRPEPQWAAQGIWTQEAQGVHGISREQLEGALPSAAIIDQINSFAGSRTAFCDGGRYDQKWLAMLRRAADLPLHLRFGDVTMLQNRLDDAGRLRMKQFLVVQTAPHRAGPDASRLMRALCEGIGIAWPGVDGE